jgi:hypothetical protein
MITFNSIAGVQVTYDRDHARDYGSRGRPLREGQGGPVTPEFWSALCAWMDDLSATCPWGRPELLVTGGIHGPGVDPENRHTQGRAIDIDSLWWHGREPLVTRYAGGRQAALYCAVEATLHLRFGTVLGRTYNASHVDHWHVDDGHPVGWRGGRSHVAFLQAALNACYDRQLDVDGRLGPRTRGAAADALRSLLVEPGELSAGWVPLLRGIAVRGFERAG